MKNESARWVGFRRFIARFKIVKLLVFAIPLFALLVVSQLLMQGVAHALPLAGRPLWWLASGFLYAAGMLWLYSLEVRYFERRQVSELAPRAAPLRITAGVAMGAVLFCLVLALLFLAGEVQQVRFNGFAGLSTQASASLAAAVGEELLFRGVIFRIAEEWLGTTAALIISGVVWRCVRLQTGATPISVAAIALEAGVLLGVAYSVAIDVEGARGLGRIVVRGQRALALEAGEDAERVNAFRDAAGQGHVALAQPQHLGALDHARRCRRRRPRRSCSAGR